MILVMSEKQTQRVFLKLKKAKVIHFTVPTTH